jgi:S-DNA-T family DNA segregation ATPase FtsK/SpoIIIE
MPADTNHRPRPDLRVLPRSAAEFNPAPAVDDAPLPALPAPAPPAGPDAPHGQATAAPPAQLRDDDAELQDEQDEGDGAPVPVDLPEGDPRQLYAGRVVEHQGAAVPTDAQPVRPGFLDRSPSARPVVPGWLWRTEDRAAAVKWLATYTGHSLAFHAVRAPKYLLRLSAYSLRGLGRVLPRWGRWVFDTEGHELRHHAVHQRDAITYLHLSRQRKERVRARLTVSASAGVPVGIGALVGWFLMPIADELAATVAGLVLAWHGRPVGKPFLLDSTVLKPQVARLTSDVVIRALGSLGIGEINRVLAKNPQGIAFVAPIQRDGKGWRAEIDLPHGVTAVDVIDKKPELASGLRRPAGCVWPEPVDEEHSGRLVLRVSDTTLAKTPKVPYPLLTSGTTDMFGPLPFGIDQRGRPQSITLMFAAVACGAQPRMGKTFAIRLLALGAALDPSCELHLYDGKGMGDYIMFEPVAHMFLSGSRTETLLALKDDLEGLKQEVERRAELLTKLARAGRCPEGKITPELAKDTRLGLHHVLVLLDECHLAFDTGSGKEAKLGKEITALAEYLVRVGPAAGISLIASTQRPDADSLPSGIRANVQIRYCLRVADQPTNDMVLGTSAYRTGVRATQFARSDKGIGYLAGEGDEPVIVRTYLVDGDQARTIIARARTAREQAGTLSGFALTGQVPTPTRTDTLLADLLAVWPEGEDKAWFETLATALAALRPEAYGSWSKDTVSATVKTFAIPTIQVWGKDEDGHDRNRKGIDRKAVLAAQRKAVRDAAENDDE